MIFDALPVTIGQRRNVETRLPPSSCGAPAALPRACSEQRRAVVRFEQERHYEET
jgi:hypothetical protein